MTGTSFEFRRAEPDASGSLSPVIEVRRESDGELCGHVEQRSGGWGALTVFGGLLGTHESHGDAARQVLDVGLASLAERWQLRRPGSDEIEIVCLQEADPGGVTLALGYYSLPGVPTIRVSRSQLDSGEWLLTR